MNRLALVSTILFGSTALIFAQAPLINTGPRTPVVNTGVATGGLFNGVGHVTNLGTSISGIGPKDYGFRGNRGGAIGNGHNRTVIVPYGVPVFYDSSYYQQPQQTQPNITVVVPPQQTPTVIINQNYTPERANPVLRDYSDAELPPPSTGRPQSDVRIYQAPPAGGAELARDPDADKATIFLIALKDGSIHSAIGYWTEGKTFGYVTPNANVKRVDLDSLDIETTERLNKDRKVPFNLNRE